MRKLGRCVTLRSCSPDARARRARQPPTPAASGGLPRLTRVESTKVAVTKLPAHYRRSIEVWVVLSEGQTHRSQARAFAALLTQPAVFLFVFFCFGSLQEAEHLSMATHPAVEHFIRTR